MGKFIISGFADEIAPELDKQMTVLKKLGIGFAVAAVVGIVRLMRRV